MFSVENFWHFALTVTKKKACKVHIPMKSQQVPLKERKEVCCSRRHRTRLLKKPASETPVAKKGKNFIQIVLWILL